MDQALYAKAVEIAWKEERFADVVLRMGVFHTICDALGILGKRFGDGGMKDLLIESHIVAESSVSGVIAGKQYNHAVRANKYIYEALTRLAWGEFMNWVEEEAEEGQRATVASLLENISSIDFDQDLLESVLQSPVLETTMVLWMVFLDHLRHNNGELSSFWMSYVDFVENVILGLLRASLEGNWDFHLLSIRNLIPWCFAYDKVNYARYLTPYFAEMTNLKEKHAEVEEAFQSGSFSVQLSSSNTFGRIPVDQTTEVTVNKDTQTSGGTTGFSLKPATIHRYYLTAEFRSAFLRQIRYMVQRENVEFEHTELQRSRIKKDEQAVSTLIDILEG